MAEAVCRSHKHRMDRWMPREKRVIPWGQIKKAARFAVQAFPGFLLSFAELLGIPSGFHAAFAMAMSVTGCDVRPTLAGSAAAILIRLTSGYPFRWSMLITLAIMAVSLLIPVGHKLPYLLMATACALLPTAIDASFAATAAETLQGWAALALAMLSAPVMVRAIKSIKGGRHMAAMEERVAVGYLAALMVCGGARILLLGFNMGMLLSAAAVLAMALVLGAGAGAAGGMLAGVMLALQGLPLTISVALSMGGFLAGVANSLGKRKWSCGAFAMGAYLPLLLCGAAGFGCGTSILAAALALGVTPRGSFERLQQFLRRFLANDPAPGDAYAASALTAWEQTVAAMARAVPSPRDSAGTRDAQWWQERLCQGCPEYEACGCLTTELGISKAESVWEYRYADEQIWQGALENLRGMGCQRLYYLLGAMNSLRQEDEAARRVIHQAEAQRDMLVTHLTAMSGAARRFAALSSGESWWDDMAAKRIRKELAERATPASLSYVRRVQGHVQAAFELHYITGARQQAEELCLLAAAVLETPMQLASVDGDRVLLTEMPLLRAEIGAAAEAITGGDVCGDTTWSGVLGDGRFLAALSDGMGHGENAALASRQTVELLRLCLDAGYTRQQTLTAVNGMLLLGSGGERFATADVLTIDLWKGHAALDKLGAAASWVYHNGELSRVTGDSLPLGIIEEIDLSGSQLRLDAGDAVILLTDGVEDAFRSCQALEEALLNALSCESPVQAAESLLSSALAADNGERRDDQSAAFVFIRSTIRA